MSKKGGPCPRCGRINTYDFDGPWKRCTYCLRHNFREEQTNSVVWMYRRGATNRDLYRTLEPIVIEYLKKLKERCPEIPLKPSREKFLLEVMRRE